MIKISTFAVVALVACSSLAAAQSSGGIAGSASGPFAGGAGAAAVNGPTVGGSFDSKVVAKDITATAKGDGAVARNVVGSMTDGAAVSFKSDVNVGNVTADAEGNKACAENIVGSMGGSACTNK